MAGKNPRYTEVDRGQEKQYPGYRDAKPNILSFMDAVNKSQPIVQSQYEMVWSRWPRTIFFAKGINIPGVNVQTQDISHAGFTISIPTHPRYDNTTINFTIIADKEGYHYYDIRNMVLQTGHPLVAGDTRATIGSSFGIEGDEDTIEVRVRNQPEDVKFHHWVIHNFHPTAVGDVVLSHDGSSFVEFEVTGTFTHVTYLSGDEKQNNGGGSGVGNGEQSGSNGSGVAGGGGGGGGNGASSQQQGISQTGSAEGGGGQPEGSSGQSSGPSGQTSGGGGGGSSSQDTAPKTTLDDQDEKDAFSILKSVGNLGKTIVNAGASIVQSGVKAAADTVGAAANAVSKVTGMVADTLQGKYPNEKPSVIQTRAEYAVDAAKKYQEAQQKQSRDAAYDEEDDDLQPDDGMRILVGAGEDGGFVPTTGDYDQMDLLLRAVKYNHEIKGGKFKLKVDVEQELKDYENRIVNLTLPHRFGMVKPQTKNISRSTRVEIEQLPDAEPQSSDPNHRIRSIF